MYHNDTIRIHAYMFPLQKLVADTDKPLILEKDREALALWALWKMYKQYAYINKNWIGLSREYRNEYLDMVGGCITSQTIDSVDGFPEIFDEWRSTCTL